MTHGVAFVAGVLFGAYLMERWRRAVEADRKRRIFEEGREDYESYHDLCAAADALQRPTSEDVDYYDLACMAGSMTPERRN